MTKVRTRVRFARVEICPVMAQKTLDGRTYVFGRASVLGTGVTADSLDPVRFF